MSARVVVGITGASGAAVAVRVVEMLREAGTETHLVVSRWGRATLEHECGMGVRDLAPLVADIHSNGDMAAPISSGSFGVDATLVVPCSARTLGSIAAGTGDTLVARAADVALKERTRLVLAVREAPLSSIHLRNALAVSEAGGVVHPIVPTFYARPASVAELVDDIAARLVALCGVRSPLRRWGVDLGIDPRGDAQNRTGDPS
ncbi:UbiX family flavin prenyltransferase [Microbacterium betulae]|uniref:Flavin prenyltransferase UbiX n=1 Tax=Microbacterium betulae TaxID=2981139 RepID=A0AA97FH97_9MICO|nr:UbiX family flavin prenyltransferase [Microbacterium sp. AB]WOF22975.1 UbiX family flavin prenyltransferase [Microbacterium sp. AB]